MQCRLQCRYCESFGPKIQTKRDHGLGTLFCAKCMRPWEDRQASVEPAVVYIVATDAERVDREFRVPLEAAGVCVTTCIKKYHSESTIQEQERECDESLENVRQANIVVFVIYHDYLGLRMFGEMGAALALRKSVCVLCPLQLIEREDWLRGSLLASDRPAPGIGQNLFLWNRETRIFYHHEPIIKYVISRHERMQRALLDLNFI